jgi:hypothetical protein
MNKTYSDAELYDLIRATLIYPDDYKETAKELDDFFISKGFKKNKHDNFEEGMLDHVVPMEYWYEACSVAVDLANQILDLKLLKFDDLASSLEDIELEIKTLKNKLKQKIK